MTFRPLFELKLLPDVANPLVLNIVCSLYWIIFVYTIPSGITLSPKTDPFLSSPYFMRVYSSYVRWCVVLICWFIEVLCHMWTIFWYYCFNSHDKYNKNLYKSPCFRIICIPSLQTDEYLCILLFLFYRVNLKKWSCMSSIHCWIFVGGYILF